MANLGTHSMLYVHMKCRILPPVGRWRSGARLEGPEWADLSGGGRTTVALQWVTNIEVDRLYLQLLMHSIET